MRFFFLMFAPFFVFPANVNAEIDTSFDADMTLVLAMGGDEGAGPQRSNALAEVSFTTGAEYLFENGLEFSGNLSFRAQTDHPARPGSAGAIQDCPPSVVGCSSESGLGLRGGFSRVATIGEQDETGGRGHLEAAYVTLKGGWGEVVVGRDQGVAQRFYEGGPTVFDLARANSAVLDPFGTALTRTKNDITSSSEKVSLVSTRILGVRAGVSYTPDTSFNGLDRNNSYTLPGIIEPDLGESYEVGLQAYRRLYESGLRLRGSLTWSKATSQSGFYDDVETVSAGFEIERRDKFRIGASVLDSSNGGHGRYSASSFGTEWTVGDWDLRASFDQSDDDTVNLRNRSTTVGFGRDLSDNIEFTAGYRTVKTNFFSSTIQRKDELNQDAVLLELRIRK